ncbi:unnamed protein product [Linum trigynum]|uniref:Uncharacterized protein n=1 Tax=Linum trigynum TaxID=586398 RepID=A0AAV2FP62_9ROSI
MDDDWLSSAEQRTENGGGPNDLLLSSADGPNNDQAVLCKRRRLALTIGTEKGGGPNNGRQPEKLGRREADRAVGTTGGESRGRRTGF